MCFRPNDDLFFRDYASALSRPSNRGWFGATNAEIADHELKPVVVPKRHNYFMRYAFCAFAFCLVLFFAFRVWAQSAYQYAKYPTLIRTAPCGDCVNCLYEAERSYYQPVIASVTEK